MAEAENGIQDGAATPTNVLRFVKGGLQQQWTIALWESFPGGGFITAGTRCEWRDVPEVNEGDTDAAEE